MATVSDPTAQPRPYTHVFALLKQDINADVEPLRRMKGEVRRHQRESRPDAASEQSALAADRRTARARFVLYGLVRGRAWERMERNRPDGDERLKQPITTVWLGIQKRLQNPVDAPPLLQPWLLR